MNREFLQLLMDKTAFPADAQLAYLAGLDTLENAGQGAEMEKTIGDFYGDGFSIANAQPKIKAMAEASGVHEYTVWGLFLALAAERAKTDYLAKGISEQVFWDTFCDLKYKVVECKDVQGVWGNFVAFWYDIFFKVNIVKLGRLEYEDIIYQGKPYEKNGVTLNPGDTVRNIHIPSSGEPFDEAARLESYKLAYEFYKEELNGGPLICVCHSWLLYQPYADILSPASNIVGFQGDFDILYSEDTEEFGDCWRLYGADYQKPVEQYPENTSMQRAVKKHLLAGGKVGFGFGVLVFDGEKLVNR